MAGGPDDREPRVDCGAGLRTAIRRACGRQLRTVDLETRNAAGTQHVHDSADDPPRVRRRLRRQIEERSQVSDWFMPGDGPGRSSLQLRAVRGYSGHHAHFPERRELPSADLTADAAVA